VQGGSNGVHREEEAGDTVHAAGPPVMKCQLLCKIYITGRGRVTEGGLAYVYGQREVGVIMWVYGIWPAVTTLPITGRHE